MKEALFLHHVARIEESVRAIALDLGLNRRGAYVCAFACGQSASTAQAHRARTARKAEDGCARSVSETASPTPRDLKTLELDFCLANAPQGIPASYVRFWHRKMSDRGWQAKDGRPVDARNWKYSLGAYYSHASREERDEAELCRAAPAPVRKAEPKRRLCWTLCRERCARFADGRCAAGATVPPDAATPPRPPEECPRFAPKAEREAGTKCPARPVPALPRRQEHRGGGIGHQRRS